MLYILVRTVTTQKKKEKRTSFLFPTEFVNIKERMQREEKKYKVYYLMVALGMLEVQGPAEVMNGKPLYVAKPFSSV